MVMQHNKNGNVFAFYLLWDFFASNPGRWYELPMQSKQETFLVPSLGCKGELQDTVHWGFRGGSWLLPPCFDTANCDEAEKKKSPPLIPPPPPELCLFQLFF